MLTKGQEWVFDEHVSAAGWVDDERLLIASETALSVFDIGTGAHTPLVALEAENAITRSNDGRADPQGGFWIGTMGKSAEPYAGAIYRYYQGTLRRLFDRITISNAICFAPDGRTAYFSDTFSQTIQQVALDDQGWPQGEPVVFVDLRPENLNPDGAVVDAEGYLWNAQWGASRVARYSPQGVFVEAVEIDASQASCPAFGGETFGTLFVTSAADGVDEASGGMTFAIETSYRGQAEHQVLL